MDLHPDFRDPLSALADSDAEYLIVGGWAVSFHAEPRYTKDLDLLIGGEPANLKRVASALTKFGAPPHILDDLRTMTSEEFLFLGSPPARVDILRKIPGVNFEKAFPRSVRASWDGVATIVISKEDLIASKIAAGRAKDLRDVRALRGETKKKRLKRT